MVSTAVTERTGIMILSQFLATNSSDDTPWLRSVSVVLFFSASAIAIICNSWPSREYHDLSVATV